MAYIMMIIEATHLTNLFSRIHILKFDSVLTYWRQIKSETSDHCPACSFELMIGRRCCCMCLEASLSHTSLRLHLDQKYDALIQAAISSVKAHRSNGCTHCSCPPQND